MRMGILGAAVAACMLAMAPYVAKARTAPINANLLTTYQFEGNQALYWITCGDTQKISGCFGSGELSGFGNICAVLEGKAKIRGDTVTQDVYVFDSNYDGGTALYLDVYRKTDVITETYDTTTFTSLKRINLNISAGKSATCYVGGGPSYIVASTNLAQSAAEISKMDYSIQSIGGFFEPANGITVDERGYISVSFSDGLDSGFFVVGPNGQAAELGGGTALLLNEITPAPTVSDVRATRMAAGARYRAPTKKLLPGWMNHRPMRRGRQAVLRQVADRKIGGA